MPDSTLKNRIDAAQSANLALREQRNDRWYPQFHIAAPAGWINDPNGLCFYQGRYHAYFQHHPHSSQWGSMHWGHVSSEDLVTWTREPIALAPSLEEDRDGVFSGSAVEGDDGRLYAFYTGHRWRNGINEDEGNIQVQCMAVSSDGVTFEKHGVVVEGPADLLHFRDPKVWRTEGTWWMVFGACSARNRGEVWLYRSENLTDWVFDRILYRDPDEDSFMLECPDFFPLGDHWVLLICPMGRTPRGYTGRNGHHAGYVVGEWTPGGDFSPLTEYRHLDWGHNFYAPQTFEAPDGRRILFAWMGAFDRELPTQADEWAGQLTVPRVLSLDDRLRLRNRPAAEIALLRKDSRAFGTFTASEGVRDVVAGIDTAEIDLVLDLHATTAERAGLSIGRTSDGAEAAFVAYDDQMGRVVLDRRGSVTADRGIRSAPARATEDGALALRVLVDHGSVEVFLNEGEESISSFAFPGAGERRVALMVESGEAAVKELTIRPMSGHWG